MAISMKKCAHLIFLFFVLHKVDAQTWIDSNATWHYNLEELSGLSIQGFYKYSYHEDTIIDGINCQKIACSVYEFYTWPEVVFLDSNSVAEYYTYVSNDTVYYRNNDAFYVLFDFGASIGDTWIISTTNNGNGFCDDTSTVQVIDTGTVIINSQVLRTITLEPVVGSSYGLSGVYNEKFGLMVLGIYFRVLWNVIAMSLLNGIILHSSVLKIIRSTYITRPQQIANTC